VNCPEVPKLLAYLSRLPGQPAMRRLNLFSLFYLATVAAFATIGFAQINLEAWLTAGFALLCAVLSLFPWWRQVIINMGRKNSLIFDVVTIAIALAIQVYGLITESFGVSYLVIGYVIVTLISTGEDAFVLNNAENVGANQNIS
jgi:cation transport ATPase